jgi:hypothetical protein
MADGKGKNVYPSKPVDMELVYAALIAYPDNDSAIKFMEESGYEVSPAKMEVFRRGTTQPTSPYFEPFLKRREQLAPRLEAKLAEDLLSEASRATAAVSYCIEQTEQMLANGEIKDPARAARDLSQIRTQAIDKRLALQGRPTQISEHRNLDEILNKLESLGAVKSIESTAVEENV